MTETRPPCSSIGIALALAGLLAACGQPADNGAQAPAPDASAASEAAPAAAAPTPPQAEAAAAPAGMRHPYFGDLHVHTVASFDSFTFGNRVTQEDAYRFARGEEITIYGDRKAKLYRPLDFTAMTDHVEWWGTPDMCTDPNSGVYETDTCVAIRGHDWAKLTSGTKYGEIPPRREDGFCEGEDRMRLCMELRDKVWAMTQANAAKFYEPGAFTTFNAYEFTQPGPSNGHLHRNVIFKGTSVPVRPMSTYELVFDSELWRWLDENCTGECDVIAIPHNQNLSWGFAFSLERRDGTPYTDEDLMRRARIERIAEMFQVKGASECTFGVLTDDEDCAFEQVFPVCKDGQKSSCQRFGSTVRDALKLGLKTEATRGINPFKFGFIAATDTHNAIPGATEETAWYGAGGNRDYLAEQRLAPVPWGSDGNLRRNPGGLAGVWAEENTREAIFAAMKRRETFGTSGGRIAVRLFASFAYGDDLLGAEDREARAYSEGVAMGQDLPAAPDGGRPAFLVEAVRDPLSAPLATIQIVKGWLDGEEMKEAIYDVACSDGMTPDPATHRCPDNGAAVDLTTCAVPADKGAQALSALWRDPDFSAGTRAFYYARAMENPTCRWSTLQAIQDGRQPPSKDWVAPTVRERAWSSPIWYQPKS